MPYGTIKWFNPTKGFGFIQPDDNGEPVFVHASEWNKAGLQPPSGGERVEFSLGPSPRSDRLQAVDLKPTTIPAPRVSLTQRGTVRNYRTDRGFGFVAPADGSPDAFVHVSTLENSGIAVLYAGQTVRFAARMDRATGRPRVSHIELA